MFWVIASMSNRISINNLCVEKLNLEKYNGKINKAEISGDQRPFESGTFGWVRKGNVTMEGRERSRDSSFIIKQFKKKNEGAAQHAFETYGKLKSIGLKVPLTYRLDRENNRIFMTNYEKYGKVALSATSLNKHAGNLIIENIKNLASLKDEIEKQCALAAKHRVRLPVDAFFLIVPRDGGNIEMEFVIGDLDQIFSDYAKELNLDEKGCLAENLRNANTALKNIVARYVKK
jgi:hypothetical protein